MKQITLFVLLIFTLISLGFSQTFTFKSYQINSISGFITVDVSSTVGGCFNYLEYSDLQPWQTLNQPNFKYCTRDVYFNYTLGNDPSNGDLNATYYYGVDDTCSLSGGIYKVVAPVQSIYNETAWNFACSSGFSVWVAHYTLQTTSFRYCSNAIYPYACNGTCYHGPGICCGGTFCPLSSSCCANQCCSTNEEKNALEKALSSDDEGLVDKFGEKTDIKPYVQQAFKQSLAK